MKKHKPRKKKEGPSFAAIEEALREALGGPPKVKRPKKEAPHMHTITARYSVRHDWGGPRFVYTHTEATISSTECELKAEAAMKKLGYVEAIPLDIKSN